MTALEEQEVLPEFAHAVRGYDRYQVDEYIARLNEWAVGAQVRAQDAERRVEEMAARSATLEKKLAQLESERTPSPEEALEAASIHAAELVAAAVREAEGIRTRATADAERRAETADREALELLDATRRSVSGLREKMVEEREAARQRADAVLDEARRSAAELSSRANEDAERRIADSRSEASRLVAEAQAAVESLRVQIADERRQAAESVEQLRTERKEILSELNRLRGAIKVLIAGGQALSGIGAEAPADEEPTVVMAVTPPDPGGDA